MPKLYFCDTGLATALLGIQNAQQLDLHPFKGSLFENMVIVDFLKRRFNKAQVSNLFFWRDNVGNEIDLLIDKGSELCPGEIKSGQTVTNNQTPILMRYVLAETLNPLFRRGSL